MDHKSIINQLQRNSATFASQLLAQTQEEYTWRPGPEKWCLLEIVCHLLDEEKEDFRPRVKITLENPDQLPAPIDPSSWVKDRNYLEQNFILILSQFLEARADSVAWLHSLESPQWKNEFEHVKLGPISAEMLLRNWLAHDLIHLRQILRIKFAYLQATTAEDLSYAGNW